MTSAEELQQIKFALDQSAIVAVTDVPGRIRYVNDKFCEISKYSREQLIGQDHRIVNSGYHPKSMIRELWQTIARGQVWRGELRNRARDGSIYWVDTTIVPFLDDRGKPWQYMAIRYDITDRKRNEERLRDQAALSTLGQMAAVVAHEVRNPLAGIRGGAQLIQSLIGAESEAGEIAAAMIARVDALNELVGDLLLYARHREPAIAPIDIAALFGDLVASARLGAEASGTEFSVSPDCTIEVMADLDQLRIVLNNLILNAVQAVSGHGRIELGASRQGGVVVLTVADTGPGIPPEDRQRIFEPFFTTRLRGTGLGVPTARKFVEAHGGTIDYLDRPGGGTIVRVTLPDPGVDRPLPVTA